MAAKKKPVAKKQPAKKQVAKKTPAKKPAAKKAAAQPRKRPAPKSIVTTQPAVSTSTTTAGTNVSVTITTPDINPEAIAKSVTSTVVRANDIVNRSLRERVLRWFKRG